MKLFKVACFTFLLFLITGCEHIFNNQKSEIYYKTGESNFTLKITINGLTNKYEKNWAFYALEPHKGLLPINFETGTTSNGSFSPIRFKNNQLKVVGKIERPGLYSLRNVIGQGGLVFMLDYGEQTVVANAFDLKQKKELFDLTPFTYESGDSSINHELINFWEQPKMLEYKKNAKTYRQHYREGINRLYGISPEEMMKFIIKGKKNKLAKKISVPDKELQQFQKICKANTNHLKELKQQAAINFLQKDSNSYVALDYILLYAFMFGPEKPDVKTMDKYMPLFGDSLKKTNAYAVMLDKYNGLKQLQTGMIAPDFVVRDVNGDIIRLSDLRGNVVLVDFWKSTCEWCTMQKNNLLEQYIIYKDQDFEILSVSFDESQERWQKAIEKYHSPWIQAIDKNGYEASPIIKAYARPGIPFMMLLDKDGKIIAKNLISPELAEDESQNLNKQLKKVFHF